MPLLKPLARPWKINPIMSGCFDVLTEQFTLQVSVFWQQSPRIINPREEIRMSFQLWSHVCVYVLARACAYPYVNLIYLHWIDTPGIFTSNHLVHFSDEFLVESICFWETEQANWNFLFYGLGSILGKFHFNKSKRFFLNFRVSFVTHYLVSRGPSIFLDKSGLI